MSTSCYRMVSPLYIGELYLGKMLRAVENVEERCQIRLNVSLVKSKSAQALNSETTSAPAHRYKRPHIANASSSSLMPRSLDVP